MNAVEQSCEMELTTLPAREHRPQLKKSLLQIVTCELHSEGPQQISITKKVSPDFVADPRGLRCFS